MCFSSHLKREGALFSLHVSGQFRVTELTPFLTQDACPKGFLWFFLDSSLIGREEVSWDDENLYLFLLLPLFFPGNRKGWKKLYKCCTTYYYYYV